jgi:AcrR family transcriptional regulator
VTITGRAQRRAPYGANPELGRNGNRARSEILAAARDLFAEVGYHGVTVEVIAQRAGRSGPSVYQYFENKEAIFRIFVEELGAELITFATTMEDVTGPHGLDVMRHFIDGLSLLFRKHRVTAIEWPSAEAGGHQLLTPAESFLRRFAAVASPHLGLSDLADRDPLRSLPMAMLSIVQWAEYTREARGPQLSRRRLNDSLARLFHRMIDPDNAVRSEIPVAGVLTIAPTMSLLSDHAFPTVGLRRPVTPRSRPMVERILQAASGQFARKGYSGTSIQQVAEQAGVGKPNVYTYWTDREALFSTLADAASAALVAVLSYDLVVDVLRAADGGRRWLDEWIDLVVRHGAILHIWTHERLSNPKLGELADRMTIFVNSKLTVMVPGPQPAGYDPAPILLWGLLIEFPYTMSVQFPDLGRDELRELLQLMIHYGLPAIRSHTIS